MINYTKKWWLLGCHRRAERLYSTNGSNDGHRVLISQQLFIDGHAEHKGLIHKYNPLVRFRFSHLIFWRKEYNEYQLKVKRNTYNHIYEVCIKEGYITKDEGTGFPTVANGKAYNIHGFPLGYFTGLFSTYDKVWLAIGALIIALIGSSLIANVFTKKETSAVPTVQVYPTITSPNVNPVINVYPNK